MLTFSRWLERFHYTDKKPGPVMPQADQVWVLIRDAGRKGISRGELGAAIDLERETLDDVIQALTGRVKVSMKRGQRIYRAG